MRYGCASNDADENSSTVVLLERLNVPQASDGLTYCPIALRLSAVEIDRSSSVLDLELSLESKSMAYLNRCHRPHNHARF
jgi:hypothetical protein